MQDGVVLAPRGLGLASLKLSDPKSLRHCSRVWDVPRGEDWRRGGDVLLPCRVALAALCFLGVLLQPVMHLFDDLVVRQDIEEAPQPRVALLLPKPCSCCVFPRHCCAAAMLLQ